jgi:DNA-binding CsgD family transcriptional regulator
MNEALRLFEGTPPSAEHAKAWFFYAAAYLMHAEGGGPEEIRSALNRALEVAEAAGATTLKPQILTLLAYHSCFRGEVEEGFRLLGRARSEPDASRDAWAVLWLSGTETDVLLKVGRLEEATRVGLRYLEAARQLGVGDTFSAGVLVDNTVQCLLIRGRVTEAAALIEPDAMGPVDPDNVMLHACRAEIDMLHGEVDAAAERLAQTKLEASLDISRELGQRLADARLWAGRPDEALEEVQRLLERLQDTELVTFCGRLLMVGMRACADLAGQARARRDDDGVRAAMASAADLASWVKREHHVPFTVHPFMASIPAEQATWDAERARVAGASDPGAWSLAAGRWETLDYRHRAAYASWRQAEALLAAPNGGRKAAATVLSAAAGLAAEHVPLTRAVQDLARRARLTLDILPTAVPRATAPQVSASYGLTDRELEVVRLLGEGRSNAEIGAELFISPRTAGVHVTNILRKLGVTNRVHAAALAERAGLLDSRQPNGSVTYGSIG